MILNLLSKKEKKICVRISSYLLSRPGKAFEKKTAAIVVAAPMFMGSVLKAYADNCYWTKTWESKPTVVELSL
jgi:hypothetical protein